jgi:hypothetical protein
MPRSCSICTHADRLSIEEALGGSLSLRTIAKRWAVSKTALLRHRDTHLRTVPDMPQRPQALPLNGSVPQALPPITRAVQQNGAVGAPVFLQAQPEELRAYYLALMAYR